MQATSNPPNLSRPTDHEPIYSAEYLYRDVGFLLFGLLLAGLFLPACVRFAVTIIGHADRNEQLLLSVPTLIFAALSWIGLLFIWRYITDYRVALVIDERGVTYGKTFHDWASIASLKGLQGRKSRRIQLRMRKRGHRIFGQLLKTSHGLAAWEYDELMQRLRELVAPCFIHLKLPKRAS